MEKRTCFGEEAEWEVKDERRGEECVGVWRAWEDDYWLGA